MSRIDFLSKATFRKVLYIIRNPLFPVSRGKMNKSSDFLSIQRRAGKAVMAHPTPFHLYDESGIRESARALYKASHGRISRTIMPLRRTPTPMY